MPTNIKLYGQNLEEVVSFKIHWNQPENPSESDTGAVSAKSPGWIMPKHILLPHKKYKSPINYRTFNTCMLQSGQVQNGNCYSKFA